jgi:Tfp pilus assembly protein FimV
MKTRSTTMGLIVAIGLTLALATRLQAISVGDIVVQSRRGMPFLAEISLILDQQERDRGVVVELGDREEYEAEGLHRAGVIDRLEASWITGARDMVLIASTMPVQVPEFDLVLLVRSRQVTIVRTYRIGLPTQAVASQNEKQSSPPLQSPPRRVAPVPSRSSKSNVPPRAEAVPPWIQNLPERYGPVKRGRTLFGIMKELGIPKATIWQTIVFIWKANNPQFSAGNLHGLRSGVYLTVPSNLATSIATMSRKEAQGVIAQQWDAWQALRRAVSGRQRIVPVQQETAVLAETSGTLTLKPLPPVEETPAISEKEKDPAVSEKEKDPAVSEKEKEPAVSEKEKEPAAASTMVIPAEQAIPTTRVAELQSVLQGLEQLLAQQLPQIGETERVSTFVKATELQTALQGLEERLIQRLQEALQQAKAAQQTAPSTSPPITEEPTLLEQLLPTNSMVYVLAVENALLLLLVIGILWRWLRSSA